jgi:hypothetical protein
MGSLSPSGLPLIKASNVLRHSHNGNFVRENDTSTDAQSTISNSGVIRTTNLGEPFGLEFQPSTSRAFLSGLPLDRRELIHNPSATGILRLEFDKFANDSGNLAHVVTRAMGIHTSIQDRESPNSALGPMVTRTERKAFNDGWQIFDGSGCPVGTASGITDTDVSPEPTYEQPC